MDVVNLMRKGEFFFADCIAITGVGVFGYHLIDRKLVLDNGLCVDPNDTTDIFESFALSIGGAVYAGGEAAAHGSCGYFSKWVGGALEWALMSLDSDPFVNVQQRGKTIAFVSSSGSVWLVTEGESGLEITIESSGSRGGCSGI